MAAQHWTQLNANVLTLAGQHTLYEPFDSRRADIYQSGTKRSLFHTFRFKRRRVSMNREANVMKSSEARTSVPGSETCWLHFRWKKRRKKEREIKGFPELSVNVAKYESCRPWQRLSQDAKNTDSFCSWSRFSILSHQTLPNPSKYSVLYYSWRL